MNFRCRIELRDEPLWVLLVKSKRRKTRQGGLGDSESSYQGRLATFSLWQQVPISVFLASPSLSLSLSFEFTVYFFCVLPRLSSSPVSLVSLPFLASA